MRTDRWGLIACGAAGCCIVSSGCGGGSGGVGSQEKTLTLGNAVTRVVGTAQPPVSLAGLGSVVTGVSGASITSLVLNMGPQTLADTRIAYESVDSQQPGVFLIVPFEEQSKVREASSRNRAIYSSPTWSADGTRLCMDGNFSGFVSPANVSDGTSNTIFISDAAARANPSGLQIISGDGSVRTIAPSLATNPAWWPANKIAYESFQDGNSEIYTINSDGTGAANLTKNAAADTNPCWSPDGNYIYFVSDRAGNGHKSIYRMNADGTGQIPFINSGFDDWDPQFSPDGTRMAFVTNRDGNSEIYTCRADGSLPTRMTANTLQDFDPTWSPDSNWLAWTEVDATGIPNVMNMPVNNVKQIGLSAHNGARPYWSPYAPTRTIVGPAPFGVAGTGAAGFLFGQSGDTTTSIVVFNATTPSGAKITAVTPLGVNAPNFVFEIDASDSLTSLQYINDFYQPPVQTVQATAGITGALVTFNSTTGKVSNVLPFTANRSAAAPASTSVPLVYRRAFTAVYDASGRNLAPLGANEVAFDRATGKITSIR